MFPYTYKTKDKHEEMQENTVTMVDQKWKYNIESLQSGRTKFLYQQTLNNKLNPHEFTDTEEMCNYLKKSVFMKQQKKRSEKTK